MMGSAGAQLTKRNIKLYFKDKSTFLTSMITPVMLFVLFVTFLGSVYKSSFLSILPAGFSVEDKLVDTFTLCWLLSSLIGVSSVTVAFCSNIIMAQDRINGSIHDLTVAPIKRSKLAVSYYVANFLTTLIICLLVAAVGFAYIATVGWYFSFTDILLILADIVLCVFFGTAFAALVENFIKSQGGIGAVATLVSALYGFLCGAYMPISQFSDSIGNFVSLLPGTYGVSLLRNHYMNGVLKELSGDLPKEIITDFRDGFDANIYLFENKIEIWQMYLIIGGAGVAMLVLYIVISIIKGKRINN